MNAPLCPRWLRGWLGAFLVALLPLVARGADVIFDVFVGYGLGVSDGAVAEGGWFPVTCEVQNNGPSFNGSVEVSGSHGGRRVVRLELPSGTKKRFVVPLFCGSKSRTSIDAVLRNSKGRLIAEHRDLEPYTHVDALSPLVAALPRKHGAIMLPEPAKKLPQYTPGVTHLSVDTFPENPIVLEGVTMLYLHSARAIDLKAPQVTALLAWLHGGGRLVLAVEQPGDVNALDWLQTMLPCELGSVLTNAHHEGLQQWLTENWEEVPSANVRRPTANMYSRPVDRDFEAAALPVTSAKLRDGEVLAGTSREPLMISARRGRGELVVLLFSPELAPFNSWVNRNWFWAALARVPSWWLGGANAPSYSSTGLDGVFGAMVDSRQIRKLPIGWLLLLLIVYLVVIGPLDQFWLKKINKQMLTWITFPTYVVIFSGLIYFIGYTLRSGQTEWNELQIVDVVPHGGRADLRGRTYGSAYSPLNANYALASDQAFATFRGEVTAAGEQAERDDIIELLGHSFSARVAVPVWTSQLYVNDWWRQDNAPLDVAVSSRGAMWQVEIRGAAYRKMTQAKVVAGDQVYSLFDNNGFKAGNKYTLNRGSGITLASYVQGQLSQINMAAQQRNSQFGSQYGGHLENVLDSATASSFLSAVSSDQSNPQQNQPQFGYMGRFTAPRGFDLTADVRRGAAVFIAYAPDESVAAPLNKFTPRLSQKKLVLRVITPIER